MSFRDNLLYLRASHDLTQEQLAEQLGVSRQSVAKWESDKSYPEMDKLICMCQIFDCTLDDLVQGDLTNHTTSTPETTTVYELASLPPEEPEPEEPEPEEPEPEEEPPTDEYGYDAHMRKFAERISTGVMLILLGVAASMVFFSLTMLPENIAAALGVLCVLAAVVFGVGSIVPASLEHATFVRQHPHLEDFYTEEDKARVRSNFAYELVGGIALVFVGIIVCIVFDGGPFEDLIGLPVMMLFIAVGTKSIIHGSMVLGMTNIASYNQGAAEVLEAEDIERSKALTPEQKSEYLEHHAVDKSIGGICGAIMIVATIAGLVLLFVPEYQSPLFWLAWPIGGLLCGFVSIMIKTFARK